MQVVFTCGLCGDPALTVAQNAAAYAQAKAGILHYLQKNLRGNQILATSWYDSLAVEVTTAFPTGPLVWIAHSFGGGAAVQAISEFAQQSMQVNRPINHLILLDPVNPDEWGKPNTVDFTLPTNVLAATCFYRVATEMPWSAPIRGGSIQYDNLKRNVAHPDFPENPEVLAVIKAAITG